jgi:hypothetical protein
MSGLQGQNAPDSPRKPIIKASLGGPQLRVATAISSRCRRIATQCLEHDPEKWEPVFGRDWSALECTPKVRLG